MGDLASRNPRSISDGVWASTWASLLFLSRGLLSDTDMGHTTIGSDFVSIFWVFRDLQLIFSGKGGVEVVKLVRNAWTRDTK